MDWKLYCRKESIDVVRCTQCGLIYVPDITNESDLEKHYSQDYFEPYFKEEKTHLSQRFNKSIKELKKIQFPGALLDIGCGIGSFLNLASQAGYEVKGVEFSKYAADHARNNFGLDVFNSRFEDACYAPDTFDIITMWHILEHVTDPREFLLRVNKLLKKNGVVGLEIPNIGSIAARISGVSWELMSPKEHFFYFNQDIIKRLLRETGFSIIKTQSYLWTTPEMFLRAKAESTRGYKKGIMKILSFACWGFSVLRFRTLPRVVQGDVMAIYARKSRDLQDK